MLNNTIHIANLNKECYYYYYGKENPYTMFMLGNLLFCKFWAGCRKDRILLKMPFSKANKYSCL
jgi:hypothetical protein